MMQARMGRRNARVRTRLVLGAGLFPEATRAYARAIGDRLGDGLRVDAVTLDELKRSEPARRRAAEAELVVTFPNRQREISTLLPESRVLAIRFIPSEDTRRELAGLDPLTRLGIVSRFPALDRKSVVSGKSGSVRVDSGGCRIIKKKKQKKYL